VRNTIFYILYSSVSRLFKRSVSKFSSNIFLMRSIFIYFSKFAFQRDQFIALLNFIFSYVCRVILLISCNCRILRYIRVCSSVSLLAVDCWNWNWDWSWEWSWACSAWIYALASARASAWAWGWACIWICICIAYIIPRKNSSLDWENITLDCSTGGWINWVEGFFYCSLSEFGDIVKEVSWIPFEGLLY
jgi:hypothetical protein